MASRFDNNSLNLQKIPTPTPPDKSIEEKIFLDSDGKLKKINYAGRVEEIVPEVNLVQAEAEITEDGFEYLIRVPSPTKGLEQLKELVNNLHNINSDRIENVYDEFTRIMGTIRQERFEGDEELVVKLQAVQEQLLSVEYLTPIQIDTLLNEIRDELSSWIVRFSSQLELKANKIDLINVQDSITEIIQQVRSSIPEPVEIEVGEITGEGDLEIRKVDNTYFIDIDFPRLVQAVQQSGGGLSKKQVQKIIDESVVSGKNLVSPDGSVQIVETDDEWQLQVDAKGFTPLEGEGIIIEEVGDDYRFSVDDYISKTEVSNVSGGLSTRIDEIVEEGTTLDSPNGSITIIKDDLHFDLDVDDYISKTEVESVSGALDGRITTIEDDYLKEADISDFITTSEVASISAGLDGRIDVIEGDYLTSSDLDEYTSLTTTEAISSNLQTQIDELPSAGSLTWIEKSNNYTANNLEGILADTSLGSWTLELPSNPDLGDTVGVVDAKGSFEDNNLTITSDKNIMGNAVGMICDVNLSSFELVFGGDTLGWQIKTFLVNGTVAPSPQPTVSSLDDLDDVNTTGVTEGDVLSFDGVSWVAAAIAAGGTGNLLAVNKYTSTGTSTWTKPARCESVFVMVQGGGGAGSGVGASNFGGSGGVFNVAYITSNIGSTETVTVGAGGAGGTNSAGSSGGSSSFGSHVSSAGGAAGRGGVSSSGGASTNCGSNGGGNGGGRGAAQGSGAASGGNAGANTGGGGGGARNTTSAGQGGNGGSGYVIVMSFGEAE